MGAIGGYYDFSGKGMDALCLRDMARAMMPWKRAGSEAVLFAHAAIFRNRSFQSENQADGIYRAERERGGYFLAVDGQMEEDPSACEALIDRYRAEGLSCVAVQEGSFALALYDEARDTLLLARDREGKRPLWFAIQGSLYAFASEPRGLHDLSKEIEEILPGECVLLSPDGLHRFFGMRPYAWSGQKSRTL